jgi:hypothetical protein
VDPNIDDYFDMLSHMRPAFSETDESFIEDYIRPLGVDQDDYGNLFLEIGDKNDVMWSCHTDTVHNKAGYQELFLDDTSERVWSEANCLGADDTTGVWLMIEMIKAKKPGIYFFHRAEEQGARGSNFILNHNIKFLENINYAIALDRKGYNSFVTHQMGERTASDKFGNSLIEQLPFLKLDDTGLFTDTYTYSNVIPECTNISVGYYGQHTKNEYQSIPFMLKLREGLLALDYAKFVVDRDPKVVEDKFDQLMFGRNNEDLMTKHFNRMEEKEDLAEFIKNNPDLVASVLYSYYDIKIDDLIDFA